jgi:SM-20-related protein
VRIRNVLDPSSAARLHACLSNEVPWRVTYNDGMENIMLDALASRSQDADSQRELMRDVVFRAQSGFQYLFLSYPMITAYIQGENPSLLLHRVLEWLNDPHTLDVFRRITGIQSLHKANAQATFYRPGDFLKRHDDSGTESQGRRVAYVLSMTKGWRADWGGQLQFLDANDEVDEVWMPTFNSLALFVVPTWHTVSYVAPFARQPRYAISGWLLDA